MGGSLYFYMTGNTSALHSKYNCAIKTQSKAQNRKEKHINLVQQLKPLYIRLGKLKLKNFLGANRRKLDNIGMFEMPFISKTASYFALGILASVRLITRLIGNKRT